MRIQLMAIGTRMPSWVAAGFEDYASRLPRECRLELRQIAATKRTKGGRSTLVTEGKRMLGALPKDSRVIALDQAGTAWTSETLAEVLARWMASGRDTSLLVGGPDGLAPECMDRAETRWSLSPLTLPHALVRVVVAEQVYRAWSILQGHPYHRGG